MYEIEKRFTLPMGHRLSKHEGRCANWHGHNITVLIGVESNKLNNNDMVIDFSDLKKEAMKVLDEWDHCLLVNESDVILESNIDQNDFRIIAFQFDPTAEKLSEVLYRTLKPRLMQTFSVDIAYVTIYENENSKATYRE